MSSPRAWTALAILVACASMPCIAAGQTGWIEAIQEGTAYGVSSDGQTVVGAARNPAPNVNADQGYRWQAATGQTHYVGSFNTFFKGSLARAVSANGGVVVGESDHDSFAHLRGFRWQGNSGGGVLIQLGSPTLTGQSMAHDITDSGTLSVGEMDWEYSTGRVRRATAWTGTSPVDIGSKANRAEASAAHGVSVDGSVIVGQTRLTMNDPHAFRWTSTGGMEDLGSTDGNFGVTDANAVSGDGKVIVGYYGASKSSRDPAMWKNGVWTRLSDGSVHNGEIHDVSHDGRVMVGSVTYFEALVWDETGSYHLDNYLANYGVNMTGWSGLNEAFGCSADGRIIVGVGGITGGGSRSYRAYLPLPNRWPEISASDIAEGEVRVVKLGQKVTRSVTARDSDLDKLRLTASLPQGATLTPAPGSLNAQPVKATFSFTAAKAHEGLDFPCWIRFTDPSGDLVTRSFTISVPTNELPTVTPPDTSAPLECDGTNEIELEAFVGDADSHQRLTVDWYVNEVKKHTQTNVTPASYPKFKYKYPFGNSTVRVRVTDGFNAVSETTIVTIQDTTVPVLITPVRPVPTDPGVDFATKPRIPHPTVQEACDHALTFVLDAPQTLPLGKTTVNWTVRDDAGNESSAPQVIDVRDMERPVIVVGSDIKKFVNRGQTYATVTLPRATASDNVTKNLTIKNNAPSRFRIGTTVVTYTCRDGAGNIGKRTLRVTIVNRPPVAIAGSDVVVSTTSDKGKRVRLSASRSRDPDGHALKYFWKAKGITFNDARAVSPVALFPVGRTKVTLTVTDEGGLKRTDTVYVTVRLTGGGARRAFAADANSAFSRAATASADVLEQGSITASSAAGYRYAQAADRYGMAAGEFVTWGEGQTESDGLQSYAEMRYYQAVFGQQASENLAQAFIETGDEDALLGAVAAGIGVQVAGADLSSR